MLLCAASGDCRWSLAIVMRPKGLMVVVKVVDYSDPEKSLPAGPSLPSRSRILGLALESGARSWISTCSGRPMTAPRS
jgi:hypothetical protein